MEVKDLKLMVLPNCRELGSEVNEHLKAFNDVNDDFFVDFDVVKFSSGEGKVKINESLRDSDVYLLSDVGNYDISYNFRGRTHYMSPVEHFNDIKAVMSAIGGHAERMNIVTPLLYSSRQHKRKGRESLDCSNSLQELAYYGASNIVSFDVHDPNVVNAIPNLPFENVYPTNEILTSILNNEEGILNDILVVAPDFGASERARYYSEILGCDMGSFYKRRDISVVINGKNPVVEHKYIGPDVRGKNIIIVDDMISSGDSIIEVAEELTKRHANKVLFATTFNLMTNGIDKFEEAYQNGIMNGLYSTNLSYVPASIKAQEWYHDVNCSKLVAKIINSLNHSESLEQYQNGRSTLLAKVKSLKK